jgi:hypothetical protein
MSLGSKLAIVTSSQNVGQKLFYYVRVYNKFSTMFLTERFSPLPPKYHEEWFKCNTVRFTNF